MTYFIKINDFINLLQGNTWFKGESSCADLILTNTMLSFKDANPYKYGINHLIYLFDAKIYFFQRRPKISVLQKLYIFLRNSNVVYTMSGETVQLISKNLYITALHMQKPGN